jgi:hypothetical protein
VEIAIAPQPAVERLPGGGGWDLDGVPCFMGTAAWHIEHDARYQHKRPNNSRAIEIGGIWYWQAPDNPRPKYNELKWPRLSKELPRQRHPDMCQGWLRAPDRPGRPADALGGAGRQRPRRRYGRRPLQALLGSADRAGGQVLLAVRAKRALGRVYGDMCGL